MTSLRQKYYLAALLIASLSFSGCTSSGLPGGPNPAVTRTSIPTETPTLIPTPKPTPTFIPDTGWELLRPGLERRVLNIFDSEGERLEFLYITRLDPRDYRLDVAYHPEPQSLEAWQAETGALIVVNGGYFSQEDGVFFPTGLTVVDGKPMGSSYGDFAGMLAITANGPDLRWLEQQPYDPREPLLGALQSFPILVKPGGEIGFSEEHEDNKQARRTVIAQDASGRILFLLAPEGWFTLHQLSAFLTFSDLELDIAVNLDGGPSTGILLADPMEVIPSGTLLPIVITVHAKPLL